MARSETRRERAPRMCQERKIMQRSVVSQVKSICGDWVSGGAIEDWGGEEGKRG